MTDGTSTSESVTDRPDGSGFIENMIQVKGRSTLRVLTFFYQNKGTWTISQVARMLQMPYSTVRSALRRLSRNALVGRLEKGYTIFESRRPVVANVLSHPGKKVSIVTGEPVRCSVGAHGRVSWASDRKEMRVEFLPWQQVVDWTSGWPEHKRIDRISLRSFIVKQIRSVIDGTPTPVAGWLTYRGRQFTLRVARKNALNLYVGDHTWKEELQEFIASIPNLNEEDMNSIWNAVATACKHPKITREYHVVDPRIASARPELFRGSEPQRWLCADHDEVRILTSAEEPARGGVLRAVEGRGQRVSELERTVRDGGTLRAPVHAITRGGVTEAETTVREELGGLEKRVRAQVSGAQATAGGCA